MANYDDLKYNRTLTNPTILGTEGVELPKGDSSTTVNVGRNASPAVGTIRYNTQISLGEIYTATGWQSIDAPPTVTNISGTINSVQNSVITVTGTGFRSGCVAYVEGAGVGNIARSMATTYVSSTQCTFQTNAASVNFTGGAAFDVRVVNTSNLSGVLQNAGTVDRPPVFSTGAGSLGSVLGGGSTSFSVSGTDPDGTGVTYSLISGAFPGTYSLNTNTGAITGTAPSVGSDTTYSFTLRVTSNNFINVADRTFSITVYAPMSVSSSSTSGNNNAYSTYQTNNEIQRQGSGNTKTLSISGSNFRAGASVSLGGQACTNVSVVNSTTITCTSPAYTFSAGISLTLTVTNGTTSETGNSPNTIYTRRFGESTFPCVSGNQLYNAGDTVNAGCQQYQIIPSGRGGQSQYSIYVCGSNYDGGGFDMYLCQGCAGFNYFTQGNSCGGQNLSIWAPRSQPCWQAAQSIWGWTTGTGNGGLTYVYKPNGGGNYTGGPFRQGNYYGSGYNDWQVIDGGRWWVRNSNHSEPNGDYDGYGGLGMYGQSGYDMGWNDGGAAGAGGQYICSTNAKG